MGVVFDASVLIAAFARDGEEAEVVRRFESSRAPVILPVTVLYEVLVGIFFRRSRRETAAFRTATRGFQETPIDEPIAYRAAEIQAELMRAGRPMSHSDALIAATALMGGHVLVTKDKRFAIIAEIFGVDVHIL